MRIAPLRLNEDGGKRRKMKSFTNVTKKYPARVLFYGAIFYG
jgi:hypothetical protein